MDQPGAPGTAARLPNCPGSQNDTRSVHHMHRVLKQALKQAVKWSLIKRNPCDAVDPPRVEKLEMKTLDTTQTVDAPTEMRKTRFLIAFLLAGICGLRRGEIAALR
jgi:integrase